MTADAATLRALIARLEAGETGEAIDVDIQKAFTPAFVDVERSPVTGEVFALLVKAPDSPCADGLVLRTLWRVTRSVDAAIAFTERELPGARLAMAVGGNFSTAWIMRGWGARTRYLSPADESGNDRDLPRLIVLATLKAKLAEMEAG